METPRTRIALGVVTSLVVAFLWLPIVVICLYAFNSSNVQSWPIAGLTTRWFGPAIHNGDMQQALWLSLEAGGPPPPVAPLPRSAAPFCGHPLPLFCRRGLSYPPPAP